MKRAAIVPALLLAAAAATVRLASSGEEPPAVPHEPPRPQAESTASPSPRRRAPSADRVSASETAPPPAARSPVAIPPATAEPRFLGGRTAAEVLAPYSDVARRRGLQRFRQDMVAGGAWTQLSDLVDEDYDCAVEAFTRGFLDTVEKGGLVVDAEKRRRIEACEKSYWRITIDLQQRTAALFQKVLDGDYRDDAERRALELRRSQIAEVTDELNRERIENENAILDTAAH